jgi:diguanylate cyclase (GGDEF)-like protein
MTFYLATSFIFPRSLRLRLFMLCFVATHLPLLGYVGWGLWSGRIAIDECLLLVGMTATGTALALWGIGALLNPIHILADTLKGDNDNGPAAVPALADVGDVIQTLYAGVHRAARSTQDRIAHLDHAAHEDALTGIANRRGFLTQLEALPTQERHGSFAIVDIDHFKRVNDMLGHDEGDRVLRAFADRLSGHLRRIDLVGRWGGEEFAIFFRDSIEDEAGWALARIAERMRAVPVGEVDGRAISFSAGLCRWNGEPLEDIALCADEALYEAKRRGRDRVQRASQLRMEVLI